MQRSPRLERAGAGRTRRTRVAAAALALLALAACGDDGPQAPGEPQGVGEARIGADGGAVETDDLNVLLEIPPGALDGDTLITIRRLAPAEVPEPLRARRRLSAVYLVGPEGLRLGTPGEITIFFDEDSLPSGVRLRGLTIGKVNAGGLLEELPERQFLEPQSGLAPAGRRVGVGGQVSSFSPFAIWVDEPAGDLQLDLDAPVGEGLDTYVLRVDGGPEHAIEPFASVFLSGLPGGSHTVLLGGVPAGCSVSGENPVTVTVPPTGSVSHRFLVTCAPGDLEVTVATSGPDAPAGPFTATLASGPRADVDPVGSVLFREVPAGRESVTLGGFPVTCALTGANPRPVVVLPGLTASVRFDVTCPG
jgi:hypothetical protein